MPFPPMLDMHIWFKYRVSNSIKWLNISFSASIFGTKVNIGHYDCFLSITFSNQIILASGKLCTTVFVWESDMQILSN